MIKFTDLIEIYKSRFIIKYRLVIKNFCKTITVLLLFTFIFQLFMILFLFNIILCFASQYYRMMCSAVHSITIYFK